MELAENHEENRLRKCVYCPHCGEYVSRSYFYQHKQLYYNENSQSRRTTDDDMDGLISFEFSPTAQLPEAICDANEPQQNSDQLQDMYSPPYSMPDVEYDQAYDSDAVLFDLDESTDINDKFTFERTDEKELQEPEEISTECHDADHRKVIRAFVLFIFLWQSLFRISDSAISLMLSFITKFFSYAGTCIGVNGLHTLAKLFPKTLYRARKCLGEVQDTFTRFVSCPSCHMLYPVDSCSELDDNRKKVSCKCSYVRYPNHSQARMRVPCGQMLLKTVRSCNGSEYLAPIRTYCYLSIVNSLQKLLNRPNVVQLCEKWRNRPVLDPDTLCDVFDGQMWQHFQCDANGIPFLMAPYNYLLMLNCDWFQPFRHTQFSVGVLYLVLENLPREVRFKRENVIIVGVMPGPSEPNMNINTYLQPLLDDLKKLWEGIAVTIDGTSQIIRAAVSCLACDVPAARKVGGFTGHKATLGCNKCLKAFPIETFGEYPDYSGFDKSDWEPRSHALHVWYAFQQKNARTKEQQKTIESHYGARYSALFELPYYNAISSCVIDPMHCLFLGIAKRFFHVWLSKGLIHECLFSEIQEKVDSFCCPSDIGRIPYKIASKFSGLKADQWKNWTLYFSSFALKDILPHRDYNCWLTFVKTCSMICQRRIAESQLEYIDKNIQDFCTKFEALYGKAFLTPNMHLAAHITDCIRDHGPVYSFWLYAFERMNGILGSFQTSNHDVTVQLMRKFISMQNVTLEQWPEDLRAEFSSQLFDACYKETGSLSEIALSSADQIKPIPPLSEKSFSDFEISKIESIMTSLYCNCNIQLLRLHKSTKAIAFNENIKLASEKSRYSNCSKVIIDNHLMEINHFINCTIMVTDFESNDCTTYCHWLMHCSPYIEHPCKPWYGYPTEVWSTELSGDFSYYWLRQITSRVVFVRAKVNFGRFIGDNNVLVVVPIPMYV